MKILILTDLYPPYFDGGYELNCKNSVEELLKRGHEIAVLTSRWGIERGVVEGNVYRLLNEDRSLRDSPVAKHFGDPWRLRRRLRQVRRALALSRNYGIARAVAAKLHPDVAFVWNTQHISPSAVLAVQDQRVPTVFRLEDYGLARLGTDLCLEPNQLKKRYRQLFVGLGFNRLNTSHLLVASQTLGKRYVQAGFPIDSVAVIPEGVPSSLLRGTHELSDLPLRSPKGEIGRASCRERV